PCSHWKAGACRGCAYTSFSGWPGRRGVADSGYVCVPVGDRRCATIARREINRRPATGASCVWEPGVPARPHSRQHVFLWRIGMTPGVELLASYWTISAGLPHTDRKYSLKEMKQILDDNGIQHVELEFLTDWFLLGERKKASDIRKKKLFAAAEALGA